MKNPLYFNVNTIRKEKFKNVFTHFITTFLILFLIISCEQKTAIPPQAEITNIYNITDSTAQVDVLVTKPSNAQGDEGFGLIVDTISINGNIIEVQTVDFSVIDRLTNNYSAKISNLKSKTHYSIYLSYTGEFDIGGPDQLETFNIGSPKTFTTN